MATGTTRRTRLDLRGRTITTFIVHELHQALSDLEAGEQVEVVTTSFTAIDADLRAWCRVVGHALVEADTDGDPWRFTVAKGEERRSGRRVAIIVQPWRSVFGFSSGAWLRLVSVLIAAVSLNSV